MISSRRAGPAAFALWVLAVGAYASVATNPFSVAIAFVAVVIVGLSSSNNRPIKLFLVASFGLLLMRMVLLLMLPNSGGTALFELPSARVGPLKFFGIVTGEAVATAASESLRLALVLMAFGVVNARIDTAQMLRLTPRIFRDSALVVGIAAGLVPGLLRTSRDISDACTMRGESRRLTPGKISSILSVTVERCFLLAESMDARGYGVVQVRASSVGLAMGSLGILVGLTLWSANYPTQGSSLVMVSLGALVTTLVVAHRGFVHMKIPRPTIPGIAIVCGGVFACVFHSAWDAYPTLTPPSTDSASLLAPLLFLLPLAFGSDE